MPCRLKPEKLEDDLDKYAASAMKMKKEKVDIKEFSAYLEFPVSQTLESMFALFDEVRNNINFKNFTALLQTPLQPTSVSIEFTEV